MKKRLMQGSFTVETAMMIGVILLVIFSALAGSRIVYNRVKVIANQYENAITERYHEVVGLWGDLEEEPKLIELDKMEAVKYLRKAQFIKEM